MSYSKLLLVFILSARCVSVCMAQTELFPVYDSKTMLPTSPEAAMLGRFGDIPIGYYTGTADVSVPLYTIKEAGLDIPIVLRYHGSGIRVTDQASNVGLGWSLEPEGSIIQVVNGTEDSYDQIVSGDPTGYAFLKTRSLIGEYSVTNDIGTNDWPCSSAYPYAEDSYETLYRLQVGDGQPDIYSYNFGGYSGKFYINYETGLPVQLDKKEPITFSKAAPGHPYWTATTMNGDIFTFGVMESSTTYLVSNHTGYTYKLTSVALHTGKTIQFQYANGYYSWFTYTERYHPQYPANLTPLGEMGMQPVYDVAKFNTQNLTKIISSEVQANFNWEDRTDLISEADIDTIANNGVLSTKRIKSVDILSTVTGKKIETFRFFYSYFPYSTVGGSYTDTTGQSALLGSRLRLDSLQETGFSAAGDSLKVPCYKFGYDPRLLPLKTSFAQDYWGYYNGKNNSGLLPDLSFFYYNLDSNYINVPVYLLDSMFAGTDRSPDSAMMTAGMLNKITYPTGGFTAFDYTSNSFSNYYYFPDSAKIAATRKQTFVRDMNLGLPYDTLARSFKVPRTTIVHFDCKIDAANPLQGLTFSQLQPAYITLQKDTAGGLVTIQTWQMQPSDTATFRLNNGIEWKQDIVLNYDPNPNDFYLVTASFPNALGPQNTSTNNAYTKCTYTYYDTTGSSLKRSLGGGVRVSGIRNYTDSGVLAHHKAIRYVNNDSSSSGTLMSPLLYYYSMPMTFISVQNPGNNAIVSQQNYNYFWYISADNAVPFSNSAAGNIIGYSRVEERDLAPDGSTNGVHIYEYNNIPDDFAINCPDNPHLINGLINRETLLKSTLDTVQQTSYNYLGQQYTFFDGVKLFTKYFGISPCDVDPNNPYSAWGSGPWPLNNRYEIMFYPLNSAWYLQQQKITRYYTPGDILADTVTDTYNSLGQLATTTAYNSKHQKLVTLATYPIDSASSGQPSIQFMLNHSLYNNTLLSTVSVNDSEVERVHNAYTYYQSGAGVSILVPDSIQRSYNGGQQFTDVSFDGYGPYANLTHFIQRGSPTGLQWNLNDNKVIAQVKNATYGTFAYTSFEPDESGTWTMSDTARNRSVGITGKQSYTFTSSSQISAMVGFNQYVVSYWSRSGALSVTETGATSTVTTGPTRNGWTYYEHSFSAAGSIFTLTGSGITIDELRLYPTTAQMTTYTYSPLIGITSQCDVDNHIIYYEYDALGRLRDIRDQDGNVIKTNEYHYQGQ
jgi:YD repeat-containing protein